MRHNAKRPQRGNRPQKKGGNNKMKVYDSNGPDVRVRGTAYQITEKYETLAKDAERSGNIVLAENYRQHMEHYQRIINSFEKQMAVEKRDVHSEQPEKQGNRTEDDLGLPASMVVEAKMDSDLATA